MIRLTAFALAGILGIFAAPAKEPVFLLHRIGADRSEGVAVMDVNRDGKLDVTSGAYWYEAPSWKQHPLREALTEGEFVVNCGEFAIDADRDGLLDIISAGWQEDGIFFYRNPGKPGVKWEKQKVAASLHTEGMISADIDGDGFPDVLPCHYTDNGMFWLRIRDGKFEKRMVGKFGDHHGVGFGDLDGDGKGDILTPLGWYRQIDASKDQWEWHGEFQLGETGIGILAYDVNGDGKKDLIFAQGHDYGLAWLEQGRDKKGARTWTKHVIDDTYSQIHNLQLVDLNGDGKPEILAGKRYRGHNEKDPGSFDPLAIFYYTIEPGKQPKITRYPIAYNSIAGAGTQFVVTDLDGDGDLDIVCAGKTGQFWFENLTINKVPWQERDILFEKYPGR